MAGPNDNIPTGPIDPVVLDEAEVAVLPNGFTITDLIPDGNLAGNRAAFREGLSTVNGIYQLDFRRPGRYVEGAEAIMQSIEIILNTRPGSQPFRSTFGSGIWQYIDRPLNVAAPLMAASIRENLARWEPRIEVKFVRYRFQNSEGGNTGTLSGIIFDIGWRLLVAASETQVSQVFAAVPTAAEPDVTPQIYRILATEAGDAILTEAGEAILL